MGPSLIPSVPPGDILCELTRQRRASRPEPAFVGWGGGGLSGPTGLRDFLYGLGDFLYGLRNLLNRLRIVLNRLENRRNGLRKERLGRRDHWPWLLGVGSGRTDEECRQAVADRLNSIS